MLVALVCLHSWDMDLPVKFHYNGEFIKDCGGSEAMSYIERDKVSLPEVVGHLKDHCVVMDGIIVALASPWEGSCNWTASNGG